MIGRKVFFYFFTLTLFVTPLTLFILQSLSSPWRIASGKAIAWGWQGYAALFQNPQLWEATITSLGIGFVVWGINVMVGLFTGKALTSHTSSGKAWLEALLLTPILIPSLAIAMGLHLFMIRIGLADTIWGVMIIHLVPTVPYSIKIFHNSYQQIGKAMMEQPHILGAGFWTQIFTIELPLLRPAIRSLTFLTMVISLSQYAITAIIGGGRVLTLPLVFFPFLENANTSTMAVFSLWFALVPVLMYIIIEALMMFLPYSRLPWRNHR